MGANRTYTDKFRETFYLLKNTVTVLGEDMDILRPVLNMTYI